MEKKRIDWSKVKLTKEQQKLAADNEKLIGYVLCKGFHFYGEMYEHCYGYGAIGLCKAATLYKPSPKGSFTGLACKWIQSTLHKAFDHKEDFKTLSYDVPLCPDADATFESLLAAPDEFEALEYKILVESLCQKIEHLLQPMQKEAFQLWLNGMSESEIAKKIKCAPCSVTDLIHQSKEKCRACFNPTDIFS